MYHSPAYALGWKGKQEVKPMATLDWSQCPAVESIPGKRSGAWVFKDTRMPVATVFENLQDMSVDELVEEFGVTREQVEAVLEFVAHSLETPAPAPALSGSDYSANARSL
jgi:uncharacterized protein (DUF433 family)